jgi:hypothetical protein
MSTPDLEQSLQAAQYHLLFGYEQQSKVRLGKDDHGDSFTTLDEALLSQLHNDKKCEKNDSRSSFESSRTSIEEVSRTSQLLYGDCGEFAPYDPDKSVR